jgi:hypothetical protein
MIGSVFLICVAVLDVDVEEFRGFLFSLPGQAICVSSSPGEAICVLSSPGEAIYYVFLDVCHGKNTDVIRI